MGEHGINNEGEYFGDKDIQQERLSVYFNEIRGGKRYSPR
jgi:hypothetical protein